jgi:hypothetical protein
MSEAGFLHMEPEMLRPEVQTMGEAGITFDTIWQRARTAASSAEAGIGSGVLAQAFRGKYVAARNALEQQVDPIPPLIKSVTEAAGVSTNDYERVDDLVAIGMPY